MNPEQQNLLPTTHARGPAAFRTGLYDYDQSPGGYGLSAFTYMFQPCVIGDIGKSLKWCGGYAGNIALFVTVEVVCIIMAYVFLGEVGGAAGVVLFILMFLAGWGVQAYIGAMYAQKTLQKIHPQASVSPNGFLFASFCCFPCLLCQIRREQLMEPKLFGTEPMYRQGAPTNV